ncbi:unnamed protein product [Medioppia subpectinata]|uniref:Nuclear receptor domain-containing protein n=1 Tax=Medioppia subpectinata TaxID=1979941 RepID=A0A7R9KN42_9ACAR|nr:unnamed protein product [Medioppia subpectinata]CAG2105336.1 unnamed protein product [Medioppia subpectinata]
MIMYKHMVKYLKYTYEGFNFEAITCPSCKEFFRRNAIRTDVKFRCRSDGNCKIDIKSRKRCRKCRLKKCFEMGMKMDYINISARLDYCLKTGTEIAINTNDHAHHNHTDNILVSILDFSTNSIEQQPCNNGTLCTPVPVVNANHSNNQSYINFTDISDPFSGIELDTDSQHTDLESFIDTISDLIDIGTPGSSSSEHPVVIYGQELVLSVDRPVQDYRNQLNELEGLKLGQLLSATAVLSAGQIAPDALAFVTEVHDNLGTRCWFLNSHVSLLSQIFHNFIQLNCLCDGDKWSLKKHGFLQLFVLRCVPNYDPAYRSWTFSTDNNNVISFNLSPAQELPRFVYEALINFYHVIHNEWDGDQVVLDLLSAITFYSPYRIGLKHRDTIKLYQHMFKHLLKRYLLLKCRTEWDSTAKYSKLMATLQALEFFADNQWLNISDMNPDLVYTRTTIGRTSGAAAIKQIAGQRSLQTAERQVKHRRHGGHRQAIERNGRRQQRRLGSRTVKC